MMDLFNATQIIPWNDTTIGSSMLTMNETYDNTTTWNTTNELDINNAADDLRRRQRGPYQRFTDFPLYAAAKILNEHYLTVLTAIGAPGNIAALITLCSMRPFMSSYVYMAVLAITDTLSIGLKLLYNNIFFEETILIPQYACMILMFFEPFSFYFSNWLLVCMTLERLIAIWYPLKVAEWSTKKRAITVITIIAIILSGLCFDRVVTTEAVLAKNYQKLASWCVIRESLTGYKYYIKHVYPFIEAIVYAILPVTILLICNVLIITSLRKARKARSLMVNISNKNQQDERLKQQNQVSVMLITVTTVFVITTVPFVIFFIATKDWNWKTTVVDIGTYYFLRQMAALLAHSNHATNFFLYFLSGRKFRRQFLRLFCTCFYKKAKTNKTSKYFSSLDSKDPTKNTEGTVATTDGQSSGCKRDYGNGCSFNGYTNSGFGQSNPSLNEIAQPCNENTLKEQQSS